jgi:hypothetical protein
MTQDTTVTFRKFLFFACPAINLRATGVSLKMMKRRETGKDFASRGQRRRAARLHQSFDNPEGMEQINMNTGGQRACLIADFEAGI